MKVIDVFYNPKTLDCYTFVFNEQDARTGYYTMLGTSTTGDGFSQWCEGVYTPGAKNEHLGKRVVFSDLSKQLQVHVTARAGE